MEWRTTMMSAPIASMFLAVSMKVSPLERLETLAEKYAGEIQVVKLEAPKARRLCMELSIMGMPAFLLFRDGTEVARLSDAALTPLRLNQWLDEQREGVS